MAVYSAFYVRCDGAASQTLKRLVEHLQAASRSFRGRLTVRPHPSAPWIEVESLRFVSELGDLMRALSSELETEVVGCDIVTSVSGVYLQRFRSGKETCCFSFNHEQGWTIVRGTLEAREIDGLFSSDQLEEAMESVETDAEAAEVKAVFSARKIKLESFNPFPDEWDCLARGLSLSDEDVRGFRDAELLGTSRPILIRGLRAWNTLNLLAATLVLGGFAVALLAGPVAGPQGSPAEWGRWCLGMLLTWLGFGVWWRGAGCIVAFAGSFLAGLVLSMGAVTLATLFR